jgi:methylase of polypeptide subunit release factors
MPVTWDLTSVVLKKSIDSYAKRNDLRFLDMGCGQVALLGQYFKQTHSLAIVTSVDLYEDIVACARENISRNGLDINVIESDLFGSVEGMYDVISFNPPYVSLSEQKPEKYPKIRYGGVKGTEIFESFLQTVPQYLNPNGIVLLGINCFYVPEKKCLKLIETYQCKLKTIVRQACNTSVVFVLHY